MSNSFQSLMRAVQVPSECFEAECKKNADLFMKHLKKKKRLLFSKMKKKEITKVQVIKYFQNVCDYLEQEKERRLQELAQFTQGLYDDTDDECDSSFNSKKRNLIEEIDENQSEIDPISEDKENTTPLPPKRPKLSISPLKEIDVETDNERSLEIVSINTAQSTRPIVIIEEDADPNQTFCKNDIVNKEPKILEKEIEKNNKTINIDSIKMQKPPAKTPLLIAGKNMITKAQILQPASVGNEKKAILLTKNKINNIQSDLKTPQTGTLFKSRFYKEVSANTKTKSITKTSDKSLTSTNTMNNSRLNTSNSLGTGGSAQKKTAADIRRQQEKAEQERLAKLKERADKRQENQRKLDQLRMNRQPNAASVTKKAKIIPCQPKIDVLQKKPLPAVNNNTTFTTVSTTSTTASTSGTSQSTVINQTPKSIDKTPILNITMNQSNKNILNQTPLSSATFAVSDSFQTPFSKKRVSILSDSCRKLIASHDNFSIEDLIDLESDEDAEEEYHERCRRKKVPMWCDKSNGTMMKLLEYQSRNLEPGLVFRPADLVPIDVRRVFGELAEVRDDCLEEWPEN